MLELLLLRHAKSRWDEPGVGDHGRDLAPRGVAAAARMGRLLRERGLAPDAALSSTATRAVRTWQLAAEAMGAAPPASQDERLYLAAPEQIVEVIGERGGLARRLLVVGHDPGMHQLAKRLATTGDPGALADLGAKFPTAGLALLALPVAAWAELRRQTTGELRGFWRPRELPGGG